MLTNKGSMFLCSKPGGGGGRSVLSSRTPVILLCDLGRAVCCASAKPGVGQGDLRGCRQAQLCEGFNGLWDLLTEKCDAARTAGIRGFKKLKIAFFPTPVQG